MTLLFLLHLTVQASLFAFGIPEVLKWYTGGSFARHTEAAREKMVYSVFMVLNSSLLCLGSLTFLFSSETFTKLIKDPLSAETSFVDTWGAFAASYMSLKLIRETMRQAKLSNKPYNPHAASNEELAAITPILWIVLDLCLVLCSLYLGFFTVIAGFAMASTVCDGFNGAFVYLTLTKTKKQFGAGSKLRQALLMVDSFTPTVLRFFSGPLVLYLVFKHSEKLFQWAMESDSNSAFLILVILNSIGQSLSWALRLIFTVFILLGMDLNPRE